MTNVTQNTNVAPSLTSVIDEMIANRIKWQNGTYAASNAELYAILGNCLELFNKAKDAKLVWPKPLRSNWKSAVLDITAQPA